MKKQLTDNQQKIIDSLVAEFTKENQASKKVNAKSVIDAIEEKISLTKNQEQEVINHNALEGKKVETFLEDLLEKIQPIIKKYYIEVNRCYSGSGLSSRSLYLSFNVFWQGYLCNRKVTLCISNVNSYEKVGLFSKENFKEFRVGYPSYKEDRTEKNHDAIIEKIAEWIMFHKEQEVKDMRQAQPELA